MVTPEPCGNQTERLDHPNPEDEENNFKRIFMNMIETFKEEVKNSLKEIEKTNRNLEDTDKSLKENQAKVSKQVKETVQDLKIEIKVIKKTQTNGTWKM